ncbi:15028_t:CDS:2 [Acaulospora morrowiae]|uniref:15028_t:CDS:1 n=1 Tax=Acaulospora morrowiae TaxID=94023 RepID=A0A9N9G5N1_9GLOM|nr:15028_t:CDS:2 [Acaulospora morrowiae]
MSYIKKIRIRKFCGLVELQKGVILITTFSLLNKLSGFFGMFTIFYGGDAISIISFFYSIIAAVAFAYFLYFGVLREDPRILGFYSLFYWLDLIVNILFTFAFEVMWYLVMDHAPLRPKERDNDDTISPQGTSSLPAWKVESTIANLILASVTVVHIYFGFVVHAYARFIEKHHHSTSRTSGFTFLKQEVDNNPLITSRYTSVEDDIESQI